MPYSKLAIFDISSVVYPRTVLKSGADYWGGKTASGRDELMGLPIGGIKEVLTRTFVRLKDQIPVVWVFDSRNSRKDVSTEYKATRTASADIHIQTEILLDLGKRLDIPCMKMDGFEADEIIYKIVDVNLEDYYNMDILTGDKGDIAGCIVKPGISLIGATTGAASIRRENYEFGVRNGTVVKYNSILPYNVFMGKPSNNLGVLHLPSGVRSKDLYMNFLKFCKEYEILQEHMSKREHFRSWVVTRFREGLITREDAQTILDREFLCFPRDIPEMTCKVPYYTYSRMNEDEVSNILRLFQMNDVSRFLGIQTVITGDDATRADKAYMWRYKTLYEDGTYQVDRGLNLRTEAFGGLEDFGLGDIE